MISKKRLEAVHKKTKKLIEIIGDGWSCSAALRRAGIVRTDVVILHKFPSPEWIVYREYARESMLKKKRIDSQFRKPRREVRHEKEDSSNSLKRDDNSALVWGLHI